MFMICFHNKLQIPSLKFVIAIVIKCNVRYEFYRRHFVVSCY
jgi:hypothetical protein